MTREEQPLDFSFKPSPPMSSNKSGQEDDDFPSTSPPLNLSMSSIPLTALDGKSLLSNALLSNSPMTGSSSSGSEKNCSRKRGKPLPEDLKDEAYWERRRKNNEAAKRSRDARRSKEMEVAFRAALLEQENLKLRVEVASLKTELAKLQFLILNRKQSASHTNKHPSPWIFLHDDDDDDDYKVCNYYLLKRCKTKKNKILKTCISQSSWH